MTAEALLLQQEYFSKYEATTISDVRCTTAAMLLQSVWMHSWSVTLRADWLSTNGQLIMIQMSMHELQQPFFLHSTAHVQGEMCNMMQRYDMVTCLLLQH